MFWRGQSFDLKFDLFVFLPFLGVCVCVCGGREKKSLEQMFSLKRREVTRLIIGEALIIFIKGEWDNLFT